MAQRGKKLTTGLVYWSQKQEERNDIGRQFLNISSPSLTQPLRLLILRGKRCCSYTKQQQCRWLLRLSRLSVPPAKMLVRGHPGVYRLPWGGLVVPWWKGNPAFHMARQTKPNKYYYYYYYFHVLIIYASSSYNTPLIWRPHALHLRNWPFRRRQDQLLESFRPLHHPLVFRQGSSWHGAIQRRWWIWTKCYVIILWWSLKSRHELYVCLELMSTNNW